jgi:hypothetical protein
MMQDSKYRACSDALRTRLWVLHNAIKEARNERDVAAMMLIIQEGLVEGHFLAFDLSYRNPAITVNLKLNETPWMMAFHANMPLIRTGDGGGLR